MTKEFLDKFYLSLEKEYKDDKLYTDIYKTNNSIYKNFTEETIKLLNDKKYDNKDIIDYILCRYHIYRNINNKKEHLQKIVSSKFIRAKRYLAVSHKEKILNTENMKKLINEVLNKNNDDTDDEFYSEYRGVLS